MPLTVALPSFDAFLRSARRSPAVLPRAPPSYQCLHTAISYDYYGDRNNTPSPTGSITPPGSPYYGHFVSLSPTGSATSDTDATADSWAATTGGSSDLEEETVYHHYTQTKPTWYQDLMTQPCVSIAPKPRAAACSPRQGKPTATRAKKKYLKERQRCEIVRRVRAGERQAHLAKEFGVSRAAVCYLLKHEYEILRRSMLRQQRNKRQ